MIKRILSFLLVLTIIVSSFAFMGTTANAVSSTMTTLTNLMKKFPDKKYWNHMGSDVNNPDGYTSVPCASHSGCSWNGSCSCNSFDNAIQCMGYAYKTAYDIVGSSPRTWEKSYVLDASKLRVGDVIRYRYNNHSLTVTGIKDNVISFTDANWTGLCQIRWSQMDLDDMPGFSYVLHSTSNNRLNTDIDFYKPTATSVGIPTAHEAWLLEENVNVRENPNTNSAIINCLQKGTKVYISEKYFDGIYTWGEVKLTQGYAWCVLNYASYINGSIEKPVFLGEDVRYNTNEKFTLKWSPVEYADYYTLNLYDAQGNRYKSWNISDSSCDVSVKASGEYTARVYARSKVTTSWYSVSEKISFYLSDGEFIPIDSFELNKITASVEKGSTLRLVSYVTPYYADNVELSWTSSNEAVASVDDYGQVTAKKFGKVIITCKTLNESGESASCVVSVVPSNVENLTQISSKTTENYVTVSWSAVKGATGYIVYKYNSKTKTFEKLKATTSTTYTAKASYPGEKQYFAVESYNKYADSKYVICEKKVGVMTFSLPKQVTLKQTKATSKSVTLSWTAVKNATGYIVYRYSIPSKKYKVLATIGNRTSYTATQSAGKKYVYRVRAIIKSDVTTLYGIASDKFSAISAPLNVTGVSVTAGTQKATLKWKSVSGATGYEIYIKTSDGYKLIGKTNAKTLTFTKTGLKKGSTYYFRIKAYSKQGAFSVSGASSATAKIKITK